MFSSVLDRPPPLSSPKIEINVLLLGESGVGKSTFINAFVNYLIFDTLQQAEQNQSVVLIPVSFLTTIGDQFEEFIVKFGDVDTNEDYEHQGQSVTQHCRSYLFHLNDTCILRLIDSPGMGDTRGLTQDDKNIEHILTYVNNLSHLNAVCLLLKPNASRLNVFFRSCINQLFTYLTPTAYDNVIFCFTNSRATFFAPGDTGPLLRKMLQNEHHNQIPFGKTNTFCFDSESFRYLAAKKCGIDFDEFQKEECTKSWMTSVVESVRLLEYIVTRTPYHLHEYQSPRKAALEISMLARPLMETIRLVIFNQILCERKMTTCRIILNYEPVDAVELCSNCASCEIVQLGLLFYMRFQGVRLQEDKIPGHQCYSDGEGFPIEYTTNYVLLQEPQDTTTHLFSDILQNYDKLIHFLQQQGLSPQRDPFTLVLERFMLEEHQIRYSIEGDISMNERLLEILSSIESMRITNTAALQESNERLSLPDIYQIIDDLKSSHESMQMQIDSIQESRRLKMKACEKQIETNLQPRNELFTKLIDRFE